MSARPFSLAALVALGLAGCEPPGFELAEKPPALPVAATWTVKLDAKLPTDVQPLPDGGFVVLDGYNGRALRYGADRTPAGVLGGTPEWGRPVRMAPADDGGWWLADPGMDGDLGAVVRTDADGAVTSVVVPWSDDAGALPWAPVAVRQLGDTLVVADREGRVGWIDPLSGKVQHVLDKDVDGQRLGLVTDLVVAPGGALLAVDTLGPRIHRISADRAAADAWGVWGLWAGSMFKPKSAALGRDGTTLVADSFLGVVQLFDEGGAYLGEPGGDDAPIRFEHPLAVRALDEDTWIVLDARAGTVVGFDLAADTFRDARKNAKVRVLRVPLKDPATQGAAGEGGRACLECHDGFVNDDREVWDPDLSHHPVDIEPIEKPPAFFPLDETGKIVCETCHSPHGVVDLEAAVAAGSDEERLALVRHQAVGESFTRLARANSELCVACHGDAAHSQVLENMGVAGRGHPTGRALADAMAKRGDVGPDGIPEPLRTDCLTCHAPHGSADKSLTRETAEGRACVGCHEENARHGVNHPLERRPGQDVPAPRKGAKLQLARDGGLVCHTCHDLLEGQTDALLRQPADGGAICLACHDERKDLVEGPHRKVKGAGGLACLGCHDPHGGDLDDHLLTTVAQATKGDPDGCLTCHGPRGKVAKADAHPGSRGHPADGRAIPGETERLTCRTCHDPHEAGMPDDAGCAECHEEQGQADARGGHGDASCLDCHPAHDDVPKARATAETSNPAALRCLACHGPGARAADAPTVSAFAHPAPVFLPDGRRWSPLGDLPLYGPDGKAVAAGQNGDLICQSCHLTHGPDAKRKGDKLRRPDWERACSSCHGEEALPLYRYFHAPERREGLGRPKK